MIKNIVFDIGNVILNFNITDVLDRFTDDEKSKKFILENIINSPEWLKNSLIDTGYVSRDDAIAIVKDRTNHTNDSLIEKFWTTYNDYAKVDIRFFDVLKSLQLKNYKIFLLSNINPYTRELVERSGLLELVDGVVFSYEEHMVKPFEGIYNCLLKKYSIVAEESIFIDDNQKNIDTGNKLGFIAKKVEPDNFESVVGVLQEYDLI